MAKKKNKTAIRPWCWYCEREFEDEKVLMQHQKAKHFKCNMCPRRLNTAGGLAVHIQQVHKLEPENLPRIENALPGRDGYEVEIFGMEGIPAPDVADYKRRKEIELGLNPGTISQPQPKKAKLDNRPLSEEELRGQLAAHKALMGGSEAPPTVAPITPDSSASAAVYSATPQTYATPAAPAPMMGISPPPGISPPGAPPFYPGGPPPPGSFLGQPPFPPPMAMPGMPPGPVPPGFAMPPGFPPPGMGMPPGVPSPFFPPGSRPPFPPAMFPNATPPTPFSPPNVTPTPATPNYSAGAPQFVPASASVAQGLSVSPPGPVPPLKLPNPSLAQALPDFKKKTALKYIDPNFSPDEKRARTHKYYFDKEKDKANSTVTSSSQATEEPRGKKRARAEDFL